LIDFSHVRRAFGACAICIVAALPIRALGDAAAPSPSPSPAALPEIADVVTPDRQEELARNSSRTVYVVSKQEMTLHGDVSVADSLERVPGIVVERYGATGSLSNVYVRGAASDQTLVLLDGRPASGAQIGTLDLGSFSTNGVNRIEVVEGGGSTLYGSASIGGVINIITNGNRRGTPYVSVSDGAFGDRAVSLEAGPLSFERRVADNAYGYYDPTTGTNQTRTNADFQLWSGRLSDGLQAGNFRLDGSAGASESNLGVPGPIGYLSTTSRQDTFVEDVRGSALHYGPQSRQTLELAASRETLNFYSAPNDPNGCLCGNDLNVEAALQLSLRNAVTQGRSSLVYGIDLTRGSGRVDAGSAGAGSASLAYTQTALYAQESVSAGSLRIVGGLRGERDGGLGGSLDPSLGLTAPLSPALTLKANYASAFRVPTIEDLAYPGFSNASLVPERTQVVDASISAERPWGRSSLSWYSTAGTNLIAPNPNYNYEAPPGPSNEPVANIQAASIAGFTLDVKTAPVRNISTQLAVTDLYRALDLTGTAFRLPYRPVFDVLLGLQYSGASRSALSSAGISTRSVGLRPASPSFPAAPGTEGAPYTVVDAFARFRLAPAALLSLRAYNLGNERYFDVAGYPSPGRAFSVQLSTR
jgi:vitamin B12 transporter